MHKAGKENVARTWSLDETFRPKITPRAQRKKAHSVQELHEGGRLQRQRTLVILPVLDSPSFTRDLCDWCSQQQCAGHVSAQDPVILCLSTSQLHHCQDCSG